MIKKNEFFFSVQKTLQSSWITGQNAWRYFFNILREKIAFFPCQMIVWIKTRFFPGHSMSTFCGFFSAFHDDKDIHQILAHSFKIMLFILGQPDVLVPLHKQIVKNTKRTLITLIGPKLVVGWIKYWLLGRQF